MFSAGTRTSSMPIVPVIDARRENFPSISTAVRPGMPWVKMSYESSKCEQKN